MSSRLALGSALTFISLGVLFTTSCGGDASEPASDAGQDSATIDAPADTGIDGGTADSAATDGGTVDSTANDSAATDSGAGDAGKSDSAVTDGGATDASFSAPTLYAALKGHVWVFGILPGFKHVTYVRFDSADGRNGAAYYYNRAVDKYSGYYTWPTECGNVGLFSADEKTREVVLQLPGGCSADAGLASVTLTFDKFTKGDGVPALRAVLESGVTESTGGSIEAYAFAPDFCDKTLTTCEDALK